MGGGISGPVVCIGVVGHFVGDDKEGQGNPCRISKIGHGEEGVKNHTQDVGNTVRWRAVKGVLYVDSIHINRLSAGDGGSLGISKINL